MHSAGSLAIAFLAGKLPDLIRGNRFIVEPYLSQFTGEVIHRTEADEEWLFVGDVVAFGSGRRRSLKLPVHVQFERAVVARGNQMPPARADVAVQHDAG